MRHVVIVRSDNARESNYIDKLTAVAIDYAEEQQAHLVGYDLRKMPGKGIIEFVSETSEFIEGLAKKLRDFDPKNTVEVDSHQVDLENPFQHN
mgnify:FL=1